MDHAVCGCSFTFGLNEDRVGRFFPHFGTRGQGGSQVRCLGLRHHRAVLSGMEMTRGKGAGFLWVGKEKAVPTGTEVLGHLG